MKTNDFRIRLEFWVNGPWQNFEQIPLPVILAELAKIETEAPTRNAFECVGIFDATEESK